MHNGKQYEGKGPVLDESFLITANPEFHLLRLHSAPVSNLTVAAAVVTSILNRPTT